MEKTWCGRYVLITEDKIYMDAVGSMGVFFSDSNISGSLNVLCKMENRVIIYPKIYHGVLPDFIPGTYTEYSGVKRLLPSQIFDYAKWKTMIRPVLPDGIIESGSVEERMELFVRYFTNSLKNMASNFEGKTLWLGLTGGKDSRTALALLENADIQYKVFTLEHGNITSGDKYIPQLLADRLNREYVFVKRKRNSYSAKRKKDYIEQTAGMAVDEDKFFYAYGQYQHLQTLGNNDIVILRSSVWECVIEYFFNYNGIDISEDNISDIFRGVKYNKKLEATLIESFRYIESDNINIEWSMANRILLDLRSGCWLSSIEQSFDMMDGIISIQPANCRLFLSILMGFDEKERSGKKHQEMIIKKVCKVISEIPFDGKTERSIEIRIKANRIKTLVAKGWWCIQNLGVKDTIIYILNKK